MHADFFRVVSYLTWSYGCLISIPPVNCQQDCRSFGQRLAWQALYLHSSRLGFFIWMDTLVSQDGGEIYQGYWLCLDCSADPEFRWLFLIEGIITFSVGAASFFLMPASAVQTKTWFRPKGWFSDREVAIVVNRVLRDDPSKGGLHLIDTYLTHVLTAFAGDMHNRQAITPKRLWLALQDYDLWPVSQPFQSSRQST